MSIEVEMAVDDSGVPRIPAGRPMTRGEYCAIAQWLRSRAVECGDKEGERVADALLAKLRHAEQMNPRSC